MAIVLKQLGDSSMGLEGRAGDAGAFIFINIPYSTTSPLSLSGAVIPRTCVVQSITLSPDVSSTNAVTAQAFAAPTTVLLASGTALGAVMVTNGAVGANVVGALSAVAGALLVPAGSRVGIVISGALGAAGSGVATIGLNPA